MMADWISGEEDMLIDFDRIDAANRGKITPSVEDSIRRMADMDLEAAWIARALSLELAQIQSVLARGRDEN